MIDELVELVEGGHQIGGAHGRRRARHARGRPGRPRGLRRRRLAPPRQEDRAEDGHAEGATSTRSAARTVTFGIGPAGTGKTYLAMALAVAALHEREVARIILTRPAVEAGERLGFLPGDLMAKVDPYLRPLFDALYDMLEPDKANNLHGARHDRGRAAGIHARPHAERQLHHPRRGAEHLARADADVPDAPRLRLEGRRHRRHHADRPAARAALRADPRARRPAARSRGSRSSSSATRTSCATSWCSGSSRPTRSTRTSGNR